MDRRIGGRDWNHTSQPRKIRPKVACLERCGFAGRYCCGGHVLGSGPETTTGHYTSALRDPTACRHSQLHALTRWSPTGLSGANTDGRNHVWIRALDSLEPRALPGTENVQGPPVFWSPDSRFIAFQAGSKLKKIDVSGGPPQEICDASVLILGGAWNRDGIVIFGTDGNGVMQVPAAAAFPTFLTTARAQQTHAFPSFPAGRAAFLSL